MVDEEEELLESKFEEMDEKDDIHTAYSKLYKNSEKYEKLYRLGTRKLSEVELEREELSTKVDEANQTIGALRFENNFLVKKTKKLDAELFQVRAQLERTLSVKLDEMLNFQKAASNKTGLGYDHFLSSYSTSSGTLNNFVFVSPASNVKPEIIEPKTKKNKGKFILGAPPRLLKRLSRTLIAPLIRSLNQRNLIYVITVEHRETPVQIAISGLPHNKATICYLLKVKIIFKTLWLLLGNS